MRDSAANHYERAFESWLIDHQVEYVRADEHQRIGTARQTVKNFDFLLYAPLGQRIVVEVKGRTFAGTSLAGLKGLECWVTRDDVRGLGAWAKALGPGHEAAFVFAYRAARIDVDFDGRDVLCLGPDRYVFFCIRLEDYRRHMKQRSVRWQTVTLSADHFRACAIDLPVLLEQQVSPSRSPVALPSPPPRRSPSLKGT